MNDKKSISEIVKDSEWQKLRKELLQQWNIRPDWCIEKLRNYLGDIHTSDEDKLRIVQNYLIGHGFRTKAIKEYTKIQKLRAEISAEMKKRKFKT